MSGALTQSHTAQLGPFRVTMKRYGWAFVLGMMLLTPTLGQYASNAVDSTLRFLGIGVVTAACITIVVVVLTEDLEYTASSGDD